MNSTFAANPAPAPADPAPVEPVRPNRYHGRHRRGGRAATRPAEVEYAG